MNPSEASKIVWIEGEVEKEQYIPEEGITIGRSTQNSVMTDDLAASRFHCKILRDADGFVLVDLESTNGTFINDSPVSGTQVLNNNDQIRIGKQVFTVKIALPAPVEEASGEQRVDLPLEETFIVKDESEYPWLMVTSGMGKGTMFSLSKKRVQIGRASRDKQWDIDLVDKAVSRPHAEIIQKDGEWMIQDLGSANGTTLNNARLDEPQILHDGDLLGFGETVLVFRIKGA